MTTKVYKMTKWQCVTPCYWENYYWNINDTVMGKRRPNRHFVEIPINSGKKATPVKPGAKIHSTNPNIDAANPGSVTPPDFDEDGEMVVPEPAIDEIDMSEEDFIEGK
jgi:hypothetical protein